MLRRFAIALMLAAAGVSTCVAEDATEQSVRELLAAMNTGELGMQALRKMIPTLRGLAPAVPETFWNEVERDFNPQELLDSLVPIYRRHLSEPDVRALITFFNTPAGNRFISRQPEILRESMEAGQRWGERTAQKVIEKLRLMPQPLDEEAPPETE